MISENGEPGKFAVASQSAAADVLLGASASMPQTRPTSARKIRPYFIAQGSGGERSTDCGLSTSSPVGEVTNCRCGLS